MILSSKQSSLNEAYIGKQAVSDYKNNYQLYVQIKR